MQDETYDVIIIGGGIAGLAAAYKLRERKILVIEKGARPGGRLYSMARPPYWLNFGAHMFGAPGSPIGDLVQELGLDSRPINGALFGISFGGKRLLSGKAETYPLRLPLGLRSRIDFARMGLRLKQGSNAVVREMSPRRGETPQDTRRRIVAYHNDVTLSKFIGPLQPDVFQILTAITERTGGDPAEMAAGYALRSFANVWSNHSPGRNIVGGSAQFPLALAERLNGKIQYDTEALRVTDTGGEVQIEMKTPDGKRMATARHCIVASSAFVAADVIHDLPLETRHALKAVRYGAFLTAGVLTREVGPMPWDKHYAISTPDRAFSTVFNQSTTLRKDGDRLPGGSLMLFRGAKGAARLMEFSDGTLEDRFRSDLLAEFPEAQSMVQEIVIQRWEAGAPYSWPGRGALQDALTKPLGRIRLAGDYLEFPNMEAAMQTGLEAATAVKTCLVTEAMRPE